MYLNKLKWIEKDGYFVNINNIYIPLNYTLKYDSLWRH